MSTTVQIRSGDSASLASPALVPMLLGRASAATTNQIYTFDPGADVTSSIGGGIGADAVLAMLRITKRRVRFTQAAPTWSPAPSVTKVGAGPSVTCALAQGSPGCFDDQTIVITVKVGGNGGEGASMGIAYDGATEIETVPIPAEVPAVIDGAANIATGAPVGNLTLVFTSPSSDTITFPTGSLTSSVAGLKAATATVAAPVTLVPADLLTGGLDAIAANPRRLKFTTAGITPANAPANVVITGKLWGTVVTETLNLSQIAAAVTSVNAYDGITTLEYPAADGTAATIAIGYSDGYATAQEVCDAFDAQADSAGLAVHARPIQDTSGATVFELFTTTAGASVTMTLDLASSTADTMLDITTATADGAAATFSPPWTGLTFTFPASSAYVVGDTYTAVCTGPRASIGALTDAASAAKDEYINSPFGFLAVAQPASNASNCAALVSALTTLTEGWAADATAPIFVDAVVGAPFFVASTVLATNNANIQTADAALLLAFQAASANFNSVATCDVYYPGATTLRTGLYRRTAALAWAAQHASAPKLAADVAEGLCLEATLLNPNLATRARNDATATTKLGGSQGPGFSALKSTQAGLGAVKFVPGATRAGPTSRLRYVGPLTVALEIARIVYPFVELWEGQTPPANPATRQLSDGEKQQRQSDVYTLLQPTLLPVGQPPNVTPLPQNKACLVQVLNPATGVFLDNGQVIVRISFIPLGEIESVFVDIVATGAIVTEA